MWKKFALKLTQRLRYAEFSVQRTVVGCEVNVTSPDCAKALFVRQTPLRFKPLVALLRTGLGARVMIAADGEAWRRTHDAVMPHLHPSVVARDYVPVIETVATDFFGRLAVAGGPVAAAARETDGAPPPPLEIAVEPLMRTVTSSIMAFVLFGESLGMDDAAYLEKTLSTAVQEIRGACAASINGALSVLFQSLGLPEFQPFMVPAAQRRALRELFEWIDDKIHWSHVDATTSPLLESLEHRYGDRTRGARRRLIVAEYAMLLTAGIETTAAALTFAIAEIAASPAIRDAAAAEARSSAADIERTGTLPEQFPYLHAILRETLRRHTLVPTMLREAQADCELSARRPGGAGRDLVKIKRGSTLRYMPVQGHMRRAIWSAPHRFDPARFQAPLTPEQKKHYQPFGIGPQSCPGRTMATLESILILHAFLRRFDLETTAAAPAIPVERNAMFTNRPVGVKVRVRRRPEPDAGGAPGGCRG